MLSFYSVSSLSSDSSSLLFSCNSSSLSSVSFCTGVRCIKDVPTFRLLMPVEYQFLNKICKQHTKVKMSFLHISETFNKGHFYLFALGYSVGIKFISSEVRYVESICSVWIWETCIMYRYTYDVEILRHIPVLVPHWWDCPKSKFIYTLSIKRNIKIRIKFTVTYVLCTRTWNLLIHCPNRVYVWILHAFSGSHIFSPHISLSNSHPGSNLSIIHVSSSAIGTTVKRHCAIG